MLTLLGVSNSIAAAPVPTPSYWNSGGYGDRTGMITVTTTATLGAGTINNLIDGNFAANLTDACWFTNGQSNREIKFDFGAGVTKIIDGFRWAEGSITVGTHGTWVFEGSNDDSSYTGIGASFTLGNNTGATLVSYQFANSTAYRYYKLRQISGGTNSAPWLLEIEFSIADPTDAVRDALEKGNRTSLITASTTATISGAGAINALIDNVFETSVTGASWFASGQSSKEVKFDLGSGVAKIVTGFTWVQSTAGSHGTWVIEGSNDDSSYTGLGSSFALGSIGPQHVTFSNTTAYRYYKLRQTAGTTSSAPWFLEIEFRIT